MNPHHFCHLLRVMLVLPACIALLSCHSGDTASADPNVDYYTCTMHPSVHSHDPKAKCPICSMDLVPVMKKGAKPASVDLTKPAEAAPMQNSEFVVPVERQQQIGVTYATIGRSPLRRTIRSVGTVSPDKTLRWEFVARVEGYVQQLFVASPGGIVTKDQPLLSIYSPDLLTTENEFVNVLDMRDRATTPESKASTNRLLAASRFRMEQWNVTPDQISELEKTRKASQFLTLRSPFHGIIENVPTEQGRKVMPGDPLVSVADLSVVWIWAEFYENEVPLLKPGLKVTLSANAYPGEAFQGEIALVNPFLSAAQRTARVRIDVKNPDFKLRPGMFVNLQLESDAGEGLAIPVAAIMPTGTRSLAFVDKGGGKLEPRAVQLGGKFGDLYEVKSGLKEGERVVTSANFLIDAESKVQGAVQSFEEPETPAAPQAPLSEADLAAFRALLEPYFQMEQALSQDNLQPVAPALATMQKAAKSLPQLDATPGYAAHLETLHKSLDAFRAASLEEARVHFGNVSAALIALVSDGPAPAPDLYVIHCAMWEKSPGGWLQTSQDIQNPFMGKKMSACGDLVKTLAHTK